MTFWKNALILCSAVLTIGCGGGGGGHDSLDLNKAVGEYLQTTTLTKDAGSCLTDAESLSRNVNDTAQLTQTSENGVAIFLPGSIDLNGTQTDDTLTTSHVFALGGMGAAQLASTWIFTGDGFDVDYVYTEGFVGQTSDCEIKFSGRAERR